jgi:hypothetical protein
MAKILVLRRRRTERKIVRMTRLLVTLDAIAAGTRPAPRRVSRIALR